MNKLRFDPGTWKRHKARRRVARLISLVPSNTLRVLLHRTINRYRISRSARLAFGVVLAVDAAMIGHAAIAEGNVFDGPFSLVMEDGVVVGCKNTFWSVMGGEVANMEDPEDGAPAMYSCTLRKNVLITEGHFFDSTGGLEVRESTWIAGRGSQVWTHGIKSGPVVIGRNCYVGTHVILSPRSAIADHTMVLPGSVVTARFNTEHATLGGVPARISEVPADDKGGG